MARLAAMTLGLYETRVRRRRRVRWAAVRWMLTGATVVGAAAFAYQVGSSQEQHQLIEFRAQVDPAVRPCSHRYR